MQLWTLSTDWIETDYWFPIISHRAEMSEQLQALSENEYLIIDLFDVEMNLEWQTYN